VFRRDELIAVGIQIRIGRAPRDVLLSRFGIDLADPAAFAFWSCVNMSDFDGCWPYERLRSGLPSPRNEYRSHSYGGKATPAHRLAWTLVYGAIRPRQHVHHRCVLLPTHTKACCRPDHLQSIAPGDHSRTHSRLYWDSERKPVGVPT
jgi:hypothetical protein